MLPDERDPKPGWPGAAGRIGLVVGAIAGGAVGVIAIVSALMRSDRKTRPGAPGPAGRGGTSMAAAAGPDEAEDAAARPAHQPGGHQPPAVQVRPGWSLPRPAELPIPSYWPAVLALAVMLVFWGLVSSLIITVVGLALFALGLAGWIGDLRHAA